MFYFAAHNSQVVVYTGTKQALKSGQGGLIRVFTFIDFKQLISKEINEWMSNTYVWKSPLAKLVSPLHMFATNKSKQMW